MSSTAAVEAHELPPGPDDPPALQARRFLGDPWSYLRETSERFGAMFTLRPLYLPALVVISDPALVQELFTADPAALHAGAANRVLEPASGAHSVLLLDDDEHLARRRLLLPAFRGERLASSASVVSGLVARELDRWPLGEPIALHPRFRSIAADVMLAVVFGVEEEDRWPELKKDVLSIQFDEQRQRARAALHEIVAVARRDGSSSHVLAMLLGGHDAHGRPLGDEEIVDELLALLVAGQETTAGSLAWAVERLSRHRAAQDLLRAAVRCGEDAYVDAVVSEVLRVRPVLQWSVRRPTEAFTLGGWSIPAGTLLAASLYLLHLRPDLFPEPDRFKPERFLAAGRRGTYTWVAFGGGVRRCLGASLALLEMNTALRQIVDRFVLLPPHDDAGDEGWRRSGITYVPAAGATVRLSLATLAPVTGIDAGRRPTAGVRR
jgi:cytochrome P450 family 135